MKTKSTSGSLSLSLALAFAAFVALSSAQIPLQSGRNFLQGVNIQVSSDESLEDCRNTSAGLILFHVQRQSLVLCDGQQWIDFRSLSLCNTHGVANIGENVCQCFNDSTRGYYSGDFCAECESGWAFHPRFGLCTESDLDLDGVGDAEFDNCVGIANAGQEDADSDGQGDVCDSCPFDPNNDEDSDSYCGDVDNCPALFNPDQSDMDSDGVGDVCDVCPLDPAYGLTLPPASACSTFNGIIIRGRLVLSSNRSEGVARGVVGGVACAGVEAEGVDEDGRFLVTLAPGSEGVTACIAYTNVSLPHYSEGSFPHFGISERFEISDNGGEKEVIMHPYNKWWTAETGGDWSVASNWNDNSVPTTTDHVLISLSLPNFPNVSLPDILVEMDGSITVRSANIDAMVDMTADFRVTSGYSHIYNLTTSGSSPSLRTDNPETSLYISPFGSLTSTSMTVTSGSLLSAEIQKLWGSSGCGSETIQSTGAGSLIRFPGLEVVDGFGCGSFTFRAGSGGAIELLDLTTALRSVSFRLDDSTSSLSLPSLSFAPQDSGKGYYVYNGANLSLSSPLSHNDTAANRHLDGAYVYLSGQGAEINFLPFIRTAYKSNFNVHSSASLSLSLLEEMEASHMDITSPGNYSFPMHTILGSSDCSSENIDADGNFVSVSFPSLTTVDGRGCGTLSFRALSGGSMDLPTVTQFQGTVGIRASGNPNSHFSAANLSAMSGGSIYVEGGATMFTPMLSDLENVVVSLYDSDSTFDASTISHIHNSDFNVGDTYELDLGHISQCDECGFSVSGVGTSVDLSGVGNYTGSTGCSSETVQANGASIDLSSVTFINGGGCGTARFSAVNNGLMILSSVVNVYNSAELEAQSGGILNAMSLQSMSVSTLDVRSGGQLLLTNLSTFFDGTIYLSSTSESDVNLSTLRNADESNIYVVDSDFVFPLIETFEFSSGCSSEEIEVSGTSTFSLPNLHTINGHGCGSSRLQVLHTSTFFLDALETVDGNVLVEVFSDARIVFGSSVNFTSTNSDFDIRNNGIVEFRGSFSNRINAASRFLFASGTTVLLNASLSIPTCSHSLYSSFEAMSVNSSTPSTDYSLSTLSLSPGAHVRLVDNERNGGNGVDTEALVVDVLELGANAVLDTNGIPLYYNSLVGSPQQIRDFSVETCT